MVDDLTLENGSLSLEWRKGKLTLHNRLSGRSRSLDFPAFQIRLGAVDLHADRFEFQVSSASDTDVAFRYGHQATGIAAEVRYSLEGDRPWFRKRVDLQAPPVIATPARLWVDIQESVPEPVRRVGYGLRGGMDAEEQQGLDTYADQPGCGYPVWVDDGFVGVEHPCGFTVPGDRLELFHHPVWSTDRRIASYAAVYGVASDPGSVPAAFEDYLWHIRLPRLDRPIFHISVGWSTRYIGDREYIESFEGNRAFAEAMLALGLRPDALALDAGWFDRRSIYRHKADDEADTRLIAFREWLKSHDIDLALWVTHNGPVGFDTDWIQEQGWRVGESRTRRSTYSSGTFVVMPQPTFEEALATRWERLVREVGVAHFKIDWDNECATHRDITPQYPTPDHVREASINAFNRIDRRLRAANPAIVTRNGWWPSPWWLCWANHTWLVNSGDCEYTAWPSRTQRDRAVTHRDACYYHVFRRAETPIPLDPFDNHEFVQAPTNAFGDDPDTWVNNMVLAATRGTTYMPLPICPEALTEERAAQLSRLMDWMRYHGAELGVRGTRMVLGNPAFGEPYGFLHPSADSAWLVLRNPSVEPQEVALPLSDWMADGPQTIRQVYPYWLDRHPESPITLLGHEVVLLRLYRKAQRSVSPVDGSAFSVTPDPNGYRYAFPGARQLTDEIGPTVHPDMRIDGLDADPTADEAGPGRRRLQWYVAVPYRFEKPELLLTLRGPADVLDGIHIKAGGCRYRGVAARYTYASLQIHGQERTGHGESRFLPPVGPRKRDDYVFRIHDGGWASVTADITGDGADELDVSAWITGYEAPARQTMVLRHPPAPGPLLPRHPFGFSTCLKLRTAQAVQEPGGRT